ncbi:methylosome subunit pICln isoform X1 [Salmo trutta]|nr:methylosome subunit pICln-like isoform X1 [Salmo trutta]XP_029555880.1 methylosome subunit pICln-like isoform X1 [Salmo trutta]
MGGNYPINMFNSLQAGWEDRESTMVNLKSVSPPSEGIRYNQGEITAVWNGEGLGPGTLYIAETCVSWFDGSGMGFTLKYPSISLHAISRDFTAYPGEHLYVMVNTKLNDNCEKDVEEEDESTDDDCDADSISPVTEICFVPSDKATLEPMFSAISECQALHPDPEDSDSDFEGDEYDVEEAEQGQVDLPTFYNFEEGLSQLSLEGQATLERLEGMLADSASQKHHYMAGVRPEDTPTGCCNESGAVGVSGQFEDVDH